MTIEKVTAPRITLVDIEGEIVTEYCFTAADGVAWTIPMHNADPTIPWVSLGVLTFCVLVLRNGFTVTGESACVSPENFDAEVGKKIAKENANEKIWPLMGYELKSKLHNNS